MVRGNVPIQLSPVRSVISTMGLYQDPQARGSTVTGDGSAADRLYRRHSHIGRDQGKSSGTSRSPSIFTGMLGGHPELQKISAEPSTSNGIPWFHSRQSANGTETARGEDEEDTCRSTETSERGTGYCSGTLAPGGEDAGNLKGYSPGPIILPSLANETDRDTRAELTELRLVPYPIPARTGGARVVGQPHVQMERENPHKEGIDLTIESDASLIDGGQPAKVRGPGGPGQNRKPRCT